MPKRNFNEMDPTPASMNNASGSMEHVSNIVDKRKPPVIISVWIPKGGTGKTTNSFSLCFTLAARGYKVLGVDCDAQRDLSNLCLRSKFGTATEFTTYTDYIERPAEDGEVPHRTLHQLLTQVNGNNPLPDAEPEEIYNSKEHDGTFHLLAGHRDMDMWDGELAKAEALMESVALGEKRMSGAAHAAVKKVAQSIDADIIILDLPPGKGAFTRSMLMSSDYFLSVTKPDCFSLEAVETLFQRIAKQEFSSGHGTRNESWIHYTHTFLCPVTANLTGVTGFRNHAFPQKFPKFLGYIICDYDTYHKNNGDSLLGVRDESSAGVTVQWMNKIHSAVIEGATAVSSVPMDANNSVFGSLSLGEDIYEENHMMPYLLAKVRKFAQLNGISHGAGKPVGFLTKDDIIKHVLKSNPQLLKNREDFRKVYDQCAWGVLRLINSTNPDGRLLAPVDDPDGGHLPPPRSPENEDYDEDFIASDDKEEETRQEEEEEEEEEADDDSDMEEEEEADEAEEEEDDDEDN